MGFIQKGPSTDLGSALNLLCDLRPVTAQSDHGDGKGRGCWQLKFSPGVLCLSSTHSFGAGEAKQTPAEQHFNLTVFFIPGALDTSF